MEKSTTSPSNGLNLARKIAVRYVQIVEFMYFACWSNAKVVFDQAKSGEEVFERAVLLSRYVLDQFFVIYSSLTALGRKGT